jgi:O-antigen/teichoic acid export membrane protein
MNQENQGLDVDLRGGRLARNTFLNFFGLFLPKVAAFATMPFTIRALGTDRFGILSLVLVVFGYFTIFDLGLAMATTRFIAAALGRKDFEAVPRYFWSTVIFQLVLGLAGTVLMAFTTPLLVEHVLKIPPAFIPEAKTSLFLLALSLPVSLITITFRGALEARQRFDLVNLVKAPTSVLNYVLVLAGALAGIGLAGITVLLLVIDVLTLVAYARFTLRAYPGLGGRMGFHKSALREVLGFGLWAMVANGLIPIIATLERFLIGALISAGAVTYYTAASEAVMSLTIFPYSLMMTLFPTFSALSGEGDAGRKDRIFGQSFKFLFLLSGLITVGLVFFAGPILTVWLGRDFAVQSAAVLRILAVGFFMNALANIPYGYLMGIGRSDIVAKLQTAELVFYAPLAWIIIRSWGIEGAAVAWTVRVAIDMLLLQGAAFRLGDLKKTSLLERGTVGAGAAFLVLVVIGFLLRPTIPGIAAFVTLIALVLVFLWKQTLTTEERQWILARIPSSLRSGR